MVYGEIEKIIGYEFKDKSLLETALTHSSYANDILGDRLRSNERLEFLGDALLDAAIGECLYYRNKDMSEGALTKLRADIVCERSLYEAANEMGLPRFLKLGNGEKHSGGNLRASMLADAFEALLAAVYLDSNDFKRASAFAVEKLERIIDLACRGKLNYDSKSTLQEKLQAKGICDIKYVLLSEEGPDHDKIFTFAVLVKGVEMGRGSGRTKKNAEAAAALMALSRMEE